MFIPVGERAAAHRCFVSPNLRRAGGAGALGAPSGPASPLAPLSAAGQGRPARTRGSAPQLGSFRLGSSLGASQSSSAGDPEFPWNWVRFLLSCQRLAISHQLRKGVKSKEF